MEIAITSEKMDLTLLESVNHLHIWELPFTGRAGKKLSESQKKLSPCLQKAEMYLKYPEKKKKKGSIWC